MSNQHHGGGGLKHVVTEPMPMDGKRERRRGAAAGRAAALRRAPSDSDCSAETASLSADSGERAARPLPPPARTANSRSRRRGSEWEVLEGLKDGQRYDKRPEVFNGYLHKKRKWPLKGWHKRFFVIDGGILVYARSPADVARGRLHGSVDVGLSVISAKARRRRIDIDADEFIYHLRAKTPEVLRTWLGVFRAHRLYRQHLLTFGARESMPKIQAPLDDLPATDTSSRISSSSIETFSSLSSDEYFHRNPDNTIHKPIPCPTFTRNAVLSSNIDPNTFGDSEQKDYKSSKKGDVDRVEKSEILPLTFDPLDEKKIFNVQYVNSSCFRNSLSSNNRSDVDECDLSTDDISDTRCTSNEQHLLSTELNSLRSNGRYFDTTIYYEYSPRTTKLNKTSTPVKKLQINTKPPERNSPICKDNKVKQTTTFFFFSRYKSRNESPEQTPMKRSRKSTNLTKYKNFYEEPILTKPLNNCMLLKTYKVKGVDKQTKDNVNSEVECDIIPKIEKETAEVQVDSVNSLKDITTASEYDRITERLIISVFESQITNRTMKVNSDDDVKYCVKQIVKELYDVKFNQCDVNPVKILFRGLLEYWLKNTSTEQFKEAIKRVQSIDRQSNRYFTKDQNLSSVFISGVTKGTQFHGYSEIEQVNKQNEGVHLQKRANKQKKQSYKTGNKGHGGYIDDSFQKERRIQELERLLKNTVYVCETACGKNKEKDIKITKLLLDNLQKLSGAINVNATEDNSYRDNSNSSTELPKIQETIKHLISETKISPGVAKDFLNAYLNYLRAESSKSEVNTSSQSTDPYKESRIENKPILCDVQAEPIQKKVSKSVTTLHKVSHYTKSTDSRSGKEEKTHPIDPGQLYLKDILDKVTTVSSKSAKNNCSGWEKITSRNEKIVDVRENPVNRELGIKEKEYGPKKFVRENHNQKAVVINLSNYDLENISMQNDPIANEMMTITVKLKEKHRTENNKHRNLDLKMSKEPLVSKMGNSDSWIPIRSRSDKKMDFIPTFPIKSGDLKPYVSSSSDGTSKANCNVSHGSENSLHLGVDSSNIYSNDNHKDNNERNDEAQSCYVMSAFKKNFTTSKIHSKKKVRVKEFNGIVLGPRDTSPEPSPLRFSDEFCIFEKNPPKVIDEKFILLLLENLNLLSKNIPYLHKDINNLFLKLRKKYDKVIKNCENFKGLSLLGKIYSDSSPTMASCSNDEALQYNPTMDNTDHKGIAKETKLADIMTNTSLDQIKELLDKSLSARSINKPIVTEVQTDVAVINVFDNPKPSTSRQNDRLETRMTQTRSSESVQSSLEQIIDINRGADIPNWYTEICTRDCAISTIIKCILENNDKPASLKTLKAGESDNSKKSRSTRRPWSKLKQDAGEYRLSAEALKVSTTSQTERKVMKLTKTTRKDLKKELAKNRDFKVYQLFASSKYDPVRSNSMTHSSLAARESDELKTLYRCASDPSYCSGLISPTSPTIRGPQAGFVSGTPGGRLAGWIIESGGPLDTASRELGQAQLSVQQLQRLLEALELTQQVHHDTDVSVEGASPSVKKDRRKFGLRKKKSNSTSKCASVELAPAPAPAHLDPSASHTALSTLTAPPSPGGGASSIPNSAASLPLACAAARPQSLPGAEALGAGGGGPASLCSLTPDHQLREDFTVLAKDLVANLKTIVATLVCERGRLRAALEAAEAASRSAPAPGGASVVAALRTNLTSALQQNSELRSRLSKIHDASDLAEISSLGHNSDAATRQFQQSLSYSSSCVSASEFFDAEEHDEQMKAAEMIAADEVIELDGDSSSEGGSLSSEEGSASSDNSDVLPAEPVTLPLSHNGVGGRGAPAEPPGAAVVGGGAAVVGGAPAGWTRRSRLPCPRPTPGGPNLWNLLYKNIGKDLSQISMPVTINEPLNMLQRLCEELEYSSLLDEAAACAHAVERMALVGAFAVSAYAAAAHRAASKPFNPLLAETYECVRDDRQFRFIAEQVSHHPPVSACHAESPRWRLWQEARIRTKFWGKSMEFQPAGRVHLRLAGSHYSWNKVTTCVHNLFGGQRWVDQYGDMLIVCHGTELTCKLSFIKASSWSNSRHEVRGAVVDGAGGARLRLHGRWSEALYAGEPPAARCLWRPGPMPADHELYYGFTRFAMELNELEPGMRERLPHTDTRLRPDQRALEEGDVEAAERYKHALEQAQRERRRDNAEHTPAWFRKSLVDGEEMWVFTGEYWKAREEGFKGDAAPRLW